MRILQKIDHFIMVLYHVLYTWNEEFLWPIGLLSYLILLQLHVHLPMYPADVPDQRADIYQYVTRLDGTRA